VRSPAAFLVLCLAASAARGGEPPPQPDRLAAELDRWKTLAAATTSPDPIWTRAKETAQPNLARAEAALKAGRRHLALLALGEAGTTLSAAAFVVSRPAAERTDADAFEAEWRRLGRELATTPSPRAFEGIRPAAQRALGEAALAQVGVYYRASLDYGKSTTPESGLFYLGTARAQRELADFCRGSGERSTAVPPPLRRLDVELDALEDELLPLYRPPLSIDRHRDFIGVSAVLKEARELTASGLLHGALLRYLEAILRTAVLRDRPAPPREALLAEVADWNARLAGSVDHSLARVLLESAQRDLESPAPEGSLAFAAAVTRDVLPRYLAALQAAPPAPRKAAPQATVTLVRWPYT